MMKKPLTLFTIFLLGFLLIRCTNSTKYDASFYSESEGFKDGIYCADIEYYYPKTKRKLNHTLKVEIQNNELIKIYWPNGGWLDNRHFSASSFENGETNFTSDNGVEYTVLIQGKEGTCTPSSHAMDENEVIKEKIGEKEGYVEEE